MTKLLKILAVWGLAMGITHAYAERGESHGRNRDKSDKHFLKGELMDKLDLTDQQKESLKALKKDGKEKVKTQWGKLKDAREALSEAFEKNVSEEELKKRFDAVQVVEKDLKKLRFEGLLEIRKILNPDQRLKFHRLMKEKRSEH